MANARTYVTNLKATQKSPDDARTRSPPLRRPPPPTTVPRRVTDHHDEGDLMERRIRRLGVFMVLCFVALFIQLNNIQVLKANSLANSPQQPAGACRPAQPDPGRASCRPTGSCWPRRCRPRRSYYKYQRVYNPYTADALLPDRRLRLHHLRQRTGRRGRVQQLPQSPTPGRPRRSGTCSSTAPRPTTSP